MPPEIPAWALDADAAAGNRLTTPWPHRVTREWAWGGSDGGGARVCIVDSGVDADHPLVGGIDRAVAPRDRRGRRDRDRRRRRRRRQRPRDGVRRDRPGARPRRRRSRASACSGPDITGAADDLLAGLDWAIEQRFDVISMSLSTRKRSVVPDLYRLADAGLLRGLAAGRVRAQPAGRELPLALRLRVLGRRPRRARPVRDPLQRRPARRVLRPRRRRGGRLDRVARRSPRRGTRSPRRTWPPSARGSAAPIPG